MAANRDNLAVFSGDVGPIEVTVTDDDGLPVDLTGATVVFVVRRSSPTGTELLRKTTASGITLANQTQEPGVCTISLTAITTSGAHYYEVQVTDATAEVRTVAYGTLTVSPSGAAA